MSADNLKAIGQASGLSPEEQKKIDSFNKALEAHKTLSNLPSDTANKVYNTQYTDAQKADLVNKFGNEDPTVKQQRGWLGTAWHYTGGAVGNALGYTGSHILAGLQNASDVATRSYRMFAIAQDQGVDLGTAWTIANDKGDKVFSPGRINEAKAKFGNDAVEAAQKIASGESIGSIIATATPEQRKYLELVDPNNKQLAAFGDAEETEKARALFQDTLDAVNASKYSPGRQFANLVTPAELEGSGLYYKAVSGTIDAAYRIIADPFLVAGKAKRLYDVNKYALEVVIGGKKIDQYFANANVQSFWNQYGAKLSELTKAQATRSPEAILKAKMDLHTLAPEFGDEVIKSFQKADGGGIVDAATAKGFFENAKQVDEMIKGGIGRQRVILPRLDAARKTRIAAVTTGRKVFNIDHVGPELVDNMWFGGATDADGIAKTIIDNQEVITNKVTAATNFKGINRFSMAYIKHRIDRTKAALTLHPMFEGDVFDVMAPDAPEKMYRLAITLMPKRESQLFKEAFGSIDEVGKRKEMYYGLWKTISEIRGMNTTLPGQAITRNLTGKNQAVHAVAKDQFSHIGSMPSDMSNFVSAPSLTDIDRAASRNGLFQWIMGKANSDLANKMTGAWSFLTLAGPRYAIRNASEDLMVNLAIGESTWGIAKSRMLSTRLNTVMAGMKQAEGKVGWSENPLGSVLRAVNRKDAQRYAAELSYVDNVVAGGKAKIAKLNDELKTTTDPVLKEAIKKEIAVAKNEIRGGTVDLTRQIFARALTEGKLNNLRSKLGLKPVNEKEAELLAEQIIHGNINSILDDVSEGGMNFATGNDYIKSAVEFAKRTGVRNHNLTLVYPQEKYVKKPGERAYKVQAVSQQDDASLVAYMMRIGYYSDDKLGAIAVANLDEEQTAIKLMKDWVYNTKAGQQFIKDSRVAAQDVGGVDTLIQLTYNRAKELFVKAGDKKLNLDLLNKIRTVNDDGVKVISGKLSMDDLRSYDNLDLPENVVGPTLIPAVELDQQTQAVFSKGWTWLGLANARMSRQPIVLEEMIRIRKQMRKSGFEDAWIESYTKGIKPDNAGGLAAATARAKKDLATVVEERALNQTLAYVDNPLVRTQLAFASRNFARFYRATEDFYRRMFRVVKYNPEALVKAALTYEGITHSGWIQKDDQGQPYFVYPGIAPVYNAVNDALHAMGINKEFKVPFPVQFGAQLKMITPSLNPDSLVPTFSGPVAGVSVTTISSLVGIFDKGAADTIKGYTLGKYAVDQPILSSFLPAHVNRLYAAMNQDDRNSQYASAWRKAVTYLEAGGHGLPKKYDEAGNLIPPTSQELEAYRLAVKNTTLAILGTRFVFGFFAPASPQVQLKSDMAQWVSDNGQANYKQAWNDLLDKYPGDYDKAMAKWVELYPNQIPFTVTESERKGLAPLRYAEEAGYFVDQNKGLFEEHPLAASLLIPHKSGFSWDAYKTMKDMGLTENKRVDDYLREVQTAADLQTYYERKNQYENALKDSAADFERVQLRKEFDDWKTIFFAGRPLVQEELSQGSQKAIKRQNTLTDLQNMLNRNLGIRPKTEAKLREMNQVFQDYQNLRSQYSEFGGSQQILTMEKENVIIKLRELATYNENTQAAYDVLFGRLLGD